MPNLAPQKEHDKIVAQPIISTMLVVRWVSNRSINLEHSDSESKWQSLTRACDSDGVTSPLKGIVLFPGDPLCRIYDLSR